jgi:hypothetical protein
MRKIITSNSQIEFQEVSSTGTLLNSIGLQLGEVYFIIKGNKVSFYLNDSEKPFDSFIWSLDIPFYLDDELIDNPNDASAALKAIMNDSFQEQLDALQEELATEEGRAQAAEEALQTAIDNETSRATSAETNLQSEITSVSATVATFDGRITNVENGLSALTETVNDEISRSVAKDAEHDTAISGLTTSINNEIARAISAETNLHNEIINEQNRAIAKENQIDVKLDNEISRSTEKDASHDSLISGLTTSLDSEIQRATTAENSLRTDLNTEIANRISGDTNLQNQLNAEIARAQNAEEDLDDKIDGEIARANSEETRIEGKLDKEIADRITDVNAEETRAIARENEIDAKIDNEISRSTAKDASHDSLISGLTTSLQSEINRATEAENSLRTDLNAEITRATNAENALDDKIDAEIRDRINAISGLNSSLNAEITRSTSKDASHDAEISGLTTSLQNEIQRAQNVENSLRNDLNDEVSDRTSADSAMLERIVAVEVGKANKSEVYTKVESDAKYATKDYVSGLTDNFYTKGQTNELLAAKADKAAAVASAEYVSSTKKINFKNIDGAIISEVDATAFIKDGMVDNVEIVNGNLVITFNTDSGKEPISIPLTDIFNPNNYYTKTEINNIENAQNSKINEISGKTDDVITEVQTISGEVQTISGKVDDMKTYVGGRGITIASGQTADTISFNLPIWLGSTNDSIIECYSDNRAKGQNSHAEGYHTEATNRGTHAEGWLTKANGDFGSHSEGNGTTASGDCSHAEGRNTIASGDYSHAEGYNTLTSSYNEAEHACGYYNISRGTPATFEFGYSGDTLFSVGNGNYNKETSATTRHNAFEIRQNGDIYISDTNASGEYYQKPMIKLQDALGQGGGGGVTPSEVQTMIDESISGKTNQSDFTAHTFNTNIHVTAAEKSTWNNKSDFSGDYNDLTNKPTIPNYTAGTGIDITNNVISAKIWSGTKAQFEALTTKSSDTIYLIYNS